MERTVVLETNLMPELDLSYVEYLHFLDLSLYVHHLTFTAEGKAMLES